MTQKRSVESTADANIRGLKAELAFWEVEAPPIRKKAEEIKNRTGCSLKEAIEAAEDILWPEIKKRHRTAMAEVRALDKLGGKRDGGLEDRLGRIFGNAMRSALSTEERDD